MKLVDQKMQDVVTSIINIYWNKIRKSKSECKIGIGGSTVEGAMTVRYFQSKNNKPVNKEVEVDFSILIGEIPYDCRFLIEDVPGKSGCVYVKNDEKLFQCMPSEYDKDCFRRGQKAAILCHSH